jgi:hypothetical protein
VIARHLLEQNGFDYLEFEEVRDPERAAQIQTWLAETRGTVLPLPTGAAEP